MCISLYVNHAAIYKWLPNTKENKFWLAAEHVLDKPDGPEKRRRGKGRALLDAERRGNAGRGKGGTLECSPEGESSERSGRWPWVTQQVGLCCWECQQVLSIVREITRGWADKYLASAWRLGPRWTLDMIRGPSHPVGTGLVRDHGMSKSSVGTILRFYCSILKMVLSKISNLRDGTVYWESSRSV